MDDKAKIPVGETGTPEAATSHQRRVLSKCNIDLEASDHNYHSVNLTPSVILNCQIPDSPNSSFYIGQIFVGIKDSVFEGSDPVRHTIELLDVLRSEHNEFPSYLSIFTDSGADHNITFLYTQCALLIGNFDVLNVGRCAPSQSYTNPAERCMSLLNIGLYGLALERGHAGAFEKIISSCKTMKRPRDKSNEHQGLKETYLASLEKPRKVLEDTFHFLELKGKRLKVFKPNKNVNEVVQTLNRIEPLITQENDIPHAQAKLKKFPSLHKYFEDHLIEGLYMLQFRKCEMRHVSERKKVSLHLFLPLYFLQMVSTIYHLKIHTVNYPQPTGIVPHCSKSITNQNQTPNKTLSF